METKPKTLQGIVQKVSDAFSVRVRIETKQRHKLYNKIVSSNKGYLADCRLAVNVGDLVEIMECRPVSKMKSWKVTKVLKSAA